MKHVLVIAAMVVAVGAVAETADAEVSTTADAVAPSKGKVTGVIELRPSWAPKAGEFHTENTLGLGYQFNPNFEVGAVQYVDTNLYNPEADAASVKIQDSFIRAKFNNLWNDPANGWNLSYQPRFYLPTQAGKRDAGLITFIRNYVNLTKVISPTFSITLTEMPIFHLYSRAGTVGDDGPVANPVFENRLYLVADWDLGGGLSFSLPLFFHQTRYADFVPGAENNGAWTFVVYSWPELTYGINDTYAVGLSYYTGNWVHEDLSGFRIAEGLEEGVAQVVLRASL